MYTICINLWHWISFFISFLLSRIIALADLNFLFQCSRLTWAFFLFFCKAIIALFADYELSKLLRYRYQRKSQYRNTGAALNEEGGAGAFTILMDDNNIRPNCCPSLEWQLPASSFTLWEVRSSQKTGHQRLMNPAHKITFYIRITQTVWPTGVKCLVQRYAVNPIYHILA